MRRRNGKVRQGPFRLGMDDGSALAYLKSINKLPETTDCYAVMEANGMTVSRLSNEQIAALAKDKEAAIEKQDYETAAKLRDIEKDYQEQVEMEREKRRKKPSRLKPFPHKQKHKTK